MVDKNDDRIARHLTVSEQELEKEREMKIKTNIQLTFLYTLVDA